MTKPPPTPCQRCRAELAEAKARLNENQLAHDGRIQALEEQIVGLRAAHRDLDARLVAAVNKHDEERRALMKHHELFVDGIRRNYSERLEKAGAEIAQMASEWQTDKRRVEDLEEALGDAIGRLEGFLQAFEGAPDPSEIDTKNLVVRLQTVLDG